MRVFHLTALLKSQIMKKQLSDAQIDLLVKRLVNDASASDETIEEVATSPELRWSIQREIRNAQHRTVAPCPPPISRYWRWLVGAVPAAAAVIVAVVIFNNGVKKPGDTLAVDSAPAEILRSEPAQRDDNIAKGVDSVTSNLSGPVRTNAAEIRPHSFSSTTRRDQTKSSRGLTAKKSEEIKTDFIPLTYAQTPSSGQILRVKVPGSMMVDLGVVSNVAKPTSLVDAEVVVGDDGMTHAIRFIRGL